MKRGFAFLLAAVLLLAAGCFADLGPIFPKNVAEAMGPGDIDGTLPDGCANADAYAAHLLEQGWHADYLYDFYFALLSDVDVFIRLGEEMVMSYFERDVEYKKALLIIALYVRMSRAAKYDAANLQKYKDLYANI